MSLTQNKFDSITFWELLGRYQVEIPIIQRDYAQGREGRENLRAFFLETLSRAISGDPQKLDFIYGDIRGDIFYPLDGQQRLTTLFLLHCYAAKKFGNCSETEMARLGRFGYETRISSREFCCCLVSKGVNIDWLAEKISPFIRDCSWFFIGWDKDPSISSMLTMLDDIHQKFREKSDLWNNLTDGKSDAIQFNFTPLKEFGLSDDLYIKMNARGRLLTAFENFKARFEKKIQACGWDDSRQIGDRFSIKADTDWTKLFWERFRQPEEFDDAYLNFINHVLVCCIAARQITAEQKKAILTSLLDDPEKMAPDNFSREDYDFLYNALNVYADPNNAVWDTIKNLHLPFWHLHNSGDTLFDSVVSSRAQQYEKRLLLHAQTIFFLNLNPISNHSEQFADWMRVIRNIVQNIQLSIETFPGAVALLNELSEGADNIYEYLADANLKSKFATTQMNEEKRKAAIIKAAPHMKSKLHEAEDSFLCQGRISFALYCINEDENALDIDLDRFATVVETLDIHFSSGINDEIRRALLTIKDGLYFKYWYSWLYAVGMPKYRLITDNDDLRKLANNPTFRHYLKELVLDLQNKTLKDLIDSFPSGSGTPQWRINLIKNDGLLAQSQLKYLVLNDDQSICYLIPRTKVANNNAGIGQLIIASNPMQYKPINSGMANPKGD